jgi:hypothetical protein
MSAAALFVPGAASRWDPLPEQIKALPRRQRVVAAEIWWAVLDHLERGLDATTEAITDAVLSQHSGWSRSFVQRGLWVLEHVAMVIERVRLHGRRIITIIARLWGRRGDRPAGSPPGSPSAPPQTPPEHFEQKTTKDRGGSSSSSEKLPEKTPEPEPDDPAIADLFRRARALVPDVTPGRIAAAVRIYGADWVRRALDAAEEWNRTCRSRGKNPVKKWRWFTGTMENWREEGGPPPAPEKPTPQPAAPRPSVEPAAPPSKLLPEQLAEMLRQWGQGDRTVRGIMARQIRGVVHDGLVAPELIAAIPAEILAGLEVPAASSV